MKKFLIALSLILLLIIWYLLYSLKQANGKLFVPISCDEEFSDLQSENQQLKDILSWTVESLNSLQLENSKVEENLSWCESTLDKYVEYIKKIKEENNSNAWDDATSNNSSSNSNSTLFNWKEIWKIKQVYTDGNWNKKIEITYGGQFTDWATCGVPESPICYINENPKTEIFTVSDNVQIFTYSFNGYVEENRISFNRFEQKFKETNNDEYGYFKRALFRITVENNVVVKIEEQYMP